MWSSPQKRVAPDGSESYLVLLDTEGIDAYDQTAQYSTQIFSLAVLLSCLFVYNHMGGIDESALDRLSLVTEMTKHIRVRAGQGDDASLGEFTPAFLWLLRDFYLKLEEEEGRKISARDYLETALAPVAGEGPSVKAKNDIRASIKSLFPDRDCYALVRPMNDEKALANLDNVPKDQLRPEFREGVAALVRNIFHKAQPKRFGNGLMTGPVLAGLVDAYVTAINNGAVPTIATAWQGVAESESRRAGDAAEKAYRDAFNPECCAEESALLAEHTRCLEIARAVFTDIAVGEESIRKAHEAKFLHSVEGYYKDLSKRKLAEAASHVNEMLYKANIAITKAARGGSSLSMMQGELAKFIEEYAATATGPTKWEKLAEFLKETYPALANEAISKAEAGSKAKVAEAQAQLEDARAALAAAEARCASVEAAHKDASHEASSLRAQINALQSQVATLTAELEIATSRAAALEAQLRDTAQGAEARMAAAEAEAEARVRAAEEAAARRTAEAQAHISAEAARASTLGAEVAALTAKLSSLDGQVAGLTSEVAEWRSRYNGAVEERVKVMAERDAARDQLHALTAERESAARERGVAVMQLAELRARVEAGEAHKADLQARLDAMIAEAQAARDAALNARAAANENSAAALIARARQSRLDQGKDQEVGGLADGFDRMSIKELQELLVGGAHEGEVWKLTNRKPAPKKGDWVELARALMGGQHA